MAAAAAITSLSAFAAAATKFFGDCFAVSSHCPRQRCASDSLYFLLFHPFEDGYAGAFKHRRRFDALHTSTDP